MLIQRPDQVPSREMPLGTCSCGAVYACDVTGHNLGSAMIEALVHACTGDWDLVCCGHSHRAEARQVADVKGGSTWLVNPGTVAALAAPATWVLGDLESMRFDIQRL